MVSQGLELELSMFRRTTISGQHPLIYVWAQNFQKHIINTVLLATALYRFYEVQLNAKKKKKPIKKRQYGWFEYASEKL